MRRLSVIPRAFLLFADYTMYTDARDSVNWTNSRQQLNYFTSFFKLTTCTKHLLTLLRNCQDIDGASSRAVLPKTNLLNQTTRKTILSQLQGYSECLNFQHNLAYRASIVKYSRLLHSLRLYLNLFIVVDKLLETHFQWYVIM